MLPYAYYLLKVIICSGVLCCYYWLLLRNKIFHGYNRFYLLATVVLSLLLPLVQITIWHTATAPAQSIKLLTAVTSSSEYLDEIVLTSRQNTFTALQLISLLYLFICLVFVCLFIKVLITVRTLLKQHQRSIVGEICLVATTAKGTPFSFLHYIFWNNNIDISSPTGQQIFKHELAHVQQKHSYDKLFVNATLIFFWCNPFFWLIRKELNMIHEFMADKIAVEDSDTEAFAAMILQATYPQHRFPLTNSFFYSPIKRRLIMLTKNKNPKAGYIARILVLPLALLLFAAFTLKSKSYKNHIFPAYKGKIITVVIDAGHGGKDPGATTPDGKIAEKDLTLSIIKKIKLLNNNDNINIILTRDNDVYQSPLEKANFSNAQNPDIFISVHMDNQTASVEIKSGMSVWIARDEYPNAEKSKLFASGIIEKFAGDYKLPVFNAPMQRTKGIWVLQEEKCPAVLIEAGYISNKNDLAYLQTDEAKETIAKNILAAIENYAGQNISQANNLKSAEAPGTAPAVDLKLKEKVAVEGINAKEKVAVTDLGLKEKAPVTAVTLKEKVSVNDTKPNKAALPEIVGIAKTDKNAGRDTVPSPASPLQSPDDKIFTKVENEPVFPGGDSAWRKYLQKNMEPEMPVKEGWKPGQYKITVTFIVNKDGSLTDIKADNLASSKTAQQCVDLIKNGPRWQPAMQNNNIVTAYRKQPFTFIVENN